MWSLITEFLGFSHKLNRQTFQISEIQKAIEFGEKEIPIKISDSQILLFWGKDQVQRSLSAQLLAGRKMNGCWDLKGILVSDGQLKKKQSIFPTILEAKSNALIKIWDMPWSSHSQGFTQEVVNSLLIHRLFEIHKKVKLVFTMEYSLLTPSNKRENLDETIEDMMRFFGKLSFQNKSIVLMLTNSTGDGQEIQTDAKNMIKKLAKLYRQGSSIRIFIQSLLNQKIIIRFVKQPQISEDKRNDRQVDVTRQYSQFVEETLKKITQELSFSSIEKFRYPKVSSISEWRQLFKKCFNKVNQSIQTIIKQFELQFECTLIQEDLSKFNFSFYLYDLFLNNYFLNDYE